jgi:membrane protein
MKPRELTRLLKQTVNEWLDDNAPSRAASLSYYTVFSIAPLLLIVVAVAGLVFGRKAVNGELTAQLQGLLGSGSAGAIQDMMASAGHVGSGILASIAGIVLLVFGACGAFVELQDTLNLMWDVDKKKTSGILGFLRARLLSFAMIGVIAFLLLVSLIVSAGLSAFGHFASGIAPTFEVLLHALNFVVAFGVVTILFAAIFKILPDTKVPWRDVWLGAAFTSLLFGVGKLLIGLYLGKSSVASSYGAAGSFAVLLVWIYYSSMIVFFGAEFTRVHARTRAKGGLASAAKAKNAKSTGSAQGPGVGRTSAPARP